MQKLEWNWKAFDGLEMAAQGWVPEGKPKAVVVLVHGLGEHCGRYEHIGAALTAKGYALLGSDLRGHGRSGGQRGHAPSFEAFMKDIDGMFAQVDERYPGLRKFIYGHSLGGILVLNYLPRRKPAVAGAVVTDAGLRTALEAQKAKIALGKILGGIFPTGGMPSGLDANMISHDPAVVQRYKADPLVHDKISFGMGKGLLGAIPYAFEHAGEVAVPLLLMHGTDDQIAFVRGSQEYAALVKSECTLKLWDGMYHEIHNEPEQAQVLAYMTDWLDKH